MDGQAGFRHHSASYPFLRGSKAAEGTAGYTDTLAACEPAKTFNTLYRSAVKFPEQVRTQPDPRRQLIAYFYIY